MIKIRKKENKYTIYKKTFTIRYYNNIDKMN